MLAGSLRSRRLAVVASLLLSSGSSDVDGPLPPENAIPVRIDPSLAAGRLDDRYVGYAFDWNKPAVLSNPSGQTVDVELALEGGPVARARQWVIGSEGDLEATSATINGAAVLPDGTVPEVPPEPTLLARGRAYPNLAPNSVGFVVLEPERPTGVCVP